MNLEKLKMNHIQSDIVSSMLRAADGLIFATVGLDIFDELGNNRYSLHGNIIIHLLARHLTLVYQGLKDGCAKDELIDEALEKMVLTCKQLINMYLEQGYGKDE